MRGECEGSPLAEFIFLRAGLSSATAMRSEHGNQV
jgi:hypothetical protein